MDLPATIGRYEILRALGQGGMGRVLLAKDSVLGRSVAVKILRDDLGIPPELKAVLFDRMRQEARAAAALSHPNMVTLHDMGEEPGVGLYLVFEYIEGPTLRDRLEDGPLPASDVATLARQLGDALTHAHEAGVIHRDVKPENIMLAPTGAKITDFGIARMPDSTLTRTGSVLGTPAYSAPESLAAGEFSPASDQFSLAATLYEALSGKRAFAGDDALVVATRVAMEAPAELAPAHVWRVLARGLSKGKEKRFATCRELGAALATSLTAPIPAPAATLTPAPRGSIVPRQTRRWQNAIAALAVAIIIVLVIIGRRAADAPDGVSLRRVAQAFASTVTPTVASSAPATPRPSHSGSAASTPSPRDAGPGSTDAGDLLDASRDPARDATAPDGSAAIAQDAGLTSSVTPPAPEPVDAGISNATLR